MRVVASRYFSLSVEDRPGQLAEFTELLRKENADLAALWGFGIGEGKAQIITVSKDPDRFRSVIAKLGVEVTEGTCFRIMEEDRVGALAEVLDRVAEKGINLHALNAIALSGDFGCYLWPNESDVDAIQELLEVD